jgi:hypothetical protein
MAEEVKLQPGWLMRDVRKATQRLSEWSKIDDPKAGSKPSMPKNSPSASSNRLEVREPESR